MPEGHTIHRLARDHRRWFVGSVLRVTSPSGRFADGAAQLDGQVLEATDAWGKHLFHRYEDGRSVHIHLGLFGRFFVHRVVGGDDAPGAPPEPRDTTRYRIVGAERAVDLVGATACELWAPGEVDALVDRLGPDPIRTDADPERAWAALQRRSVGIGRALMDQRVLAGVGNVYRAEVLFVHGLHPEVPARQVPRETWDAMWDTLVAWLRRGVRQRRIVTTEASDLPPEREGTDLPPEREGTELGRARSETRREESVHVYKRERCRRCDSPIRRWDLAGRWAYACETCQPRPRG